MITKTFQIVFQHVYWSRVILVVVVVLLYYYYSSSKVLALIAAVAQIAVAVLVVLYRY